MIQADITSVRELAEPSTKSSITHTWTSDTRDDPWMGTSGRLLRLAHVCEAAFTLLKRSLTSQEYAGLPGSSSAVNYFKSTTQSQLSRTLYEGSSIVSRRLEYIP
jgi:outer membrane protein insertion porin family